MKITFFKLPRHSVFDYQPRYYNAEKEEFEARIARAKQEAGLLPEGQRVSRIQGQMKRRIGNERASRLQVKSNIRIILIIGLLLAIAYWLLYY